MSWSVLGSVLASLVLVVPPSARFAEHLSASKQGRLVVDLATGLLIIGVAGILSLHPYLSYLSYALVLFLAAFSVKDLPPINTPDKTDVFPHFFLYLLTGSLLLMSAMIMTDPPSWFLFNATHLLVARIYIGMYQNQ